MRQRAVVTRRMLRRRHEMIWATQWVLILCTICVLINLKCHSMLLLMASSSLKRGNVSQSILEDIWIREQRLMDKETAIDSDWRQDLVIGIPTIARVGNPDYLAQSVSSLLSIGNISESQIYLLHGKPREKHVILSKVQALHPHIHLVVQDTNASAMSPYYVVTKSSTKRAIHAYVEDDMDRKRWRIAEAHDFWWLCRHLLQHTNASYIGFHQDDARLVDPLPDRLPVRLDGSTPCRHMISLYSDHTPRENRRYCSTEGLFCGMVSLVFRRSTLQEFLDWLAPLYKEQPIDWSLEDYLVANNYLIPVHASVHHLGSVSSMKGKTSILEEAMMNVQQVPNSWFNTHRVAFADRIVHNCPFQENQYHPISDNDGNPDHATSVPLVSWGIVYTVPSNQLMQHVIYHFRNKSCLRLASLKVLPLTPFGEGMARTKAVIRIMMDNLNRRYSGYEPVEVQAIPVLPEATTRAWHPDTLALTQFLHVAQYLLENTSSPLLGFSYDDILPIVRLDWESLQRQTGIVSLYRQEQYDPIHSVDNGTALSMQDPICGTMVRCGFEFMLFARSTLRDFVNWLSRNSTSSSLELQVLEFSRGQNLTIPAINATRLIGKTWNERIKH